MTMLNDMLGRIAMDNAAVKSAEICLRKVLPDLAQIEQKNTTNNLHVVMMPALLRMRSLGPRLRG